MDAGGGLAFSTATRSILTVGIVAVASFLVLFMGVVSRVTNEIIIARRFVMWARICVLGSAVCLGIILNLALAGEQRIILPHLGVVRPVVGLVTLFLTFFISSHQVFRWMAVVVQPVFVASGVYSSAEARTQIDCLADGSCTTTSGFDSSQLALMEVANLVGVFFQIWLILIGAYLLICMGACHSRYPVRLFSITKPLSQLPVPNTYTPLPNQERRESEDHGADTRDAMGNVIHTTPAGYAP